MATLHQLLQQQQMCPAQARPKLREQQEALHEFRNEVAHLLDRLYRKTPPAEADPAIASILQQVLQNYHTASKG